MKFRVLLTICIGLFSYSVSADPMADAVFSSDNDISTSTTPTNPLDTAVVIQKTYYNINDVVKTLSLYNVKSIVTENSSNTNQGYKIIANQNLKSFLDQIAPQLGYKYNYNSTTNTVVFSLINPKPVVAVVIPKPIPSPKPIASTPTPSKISVATLLPVTQQVESKVVQKPNDPYKTKYVVPKQSESGIWVLSTNDKTIKKAMERWSNQSGWTIVWDSNYDFPIKSGMEIEGSLFYAINEICRASTNTGVQLLANVATKNKTIVLSTPTNM